MAWLVQKPIEFPTARHLWCHLSELETGLERLGRVEAFHGQVCFINKSSFNDAFKIIKKTPAGIAAPIVMHIASLQANLALRFLAGLKVKKDTLYYLFFNEDGEYTLQKGHQRAYIFS